MDNSQQKKMMIIIIKHKDPFLTNTIYTVLQGIIDTADERGAAQGRSCVQAFDVYANRRRVARTCNTADFEGEEYAILYHWS